MEALPRTSCLLRGSVSDRLPDVDSHIARSDRHVATPSTTPPVPAVRFAAAFQCPYVKTCPRLLTFGDFESLRSHIKGAHLLDGSGSSSLSSASSVNAIADKTLLPASSRTAPDAVGVGVGPLAGTVFTAHSRVLTDPLNNFEPHYFQAPSSPSVPALSSKRFPCPEPDCIKSFDQASGLRCHYLTHTGERPFMCSFAGCGKTYTTNNRRKVHERSHTNENPYACTFPGCAYRAKQKCSVANHAKRHLKEASRQSPSSTPSEPELKKDVDNPFAPTSSHVDMLSILGEAAEMFAGVDPTARAKTSLENEVASFRGSLLNNTESAKGANYSVKYAYLRHDNLAVETVLSSSKPLKLEQSPEAMVLETEDIPKLEPGTFSTSGSESSLSTGPDEEPDLLQVLSNVAASVQAISEHPATLISLDGIKKYICPVPGCRKSFATSTSLRTHNVTHTGEKRFICAFEGCGKGYTTNNRLKVHSRGHSGERPYKCDFEGCGYAAAQACSLKAHQVRHLPPEVKSEIRAINERTLPCPFCGRTYKSKNSLDQHCFKEHRPSHTF